jgi:hypothetical protein
VSGGDGVDRPAAAGGDPAGGSGATGRGASDGARSSSPARLKRVAAGLAAAAALAWAAGPAPAQLGSDGTRAHALARSADDGAAEADAEGAAAQKQLQALTADARETDALRALREDAATAARALAGYRRLAQESAAEAFRLLVGLGKGGDSVRREVVEQQALLAAHEASVMAARARTEAERLRALVAETRVFLAAQETAARAAPAPVPAGQVEVPNLVGARLDAATRDLQVAGLRLGAVAGPRDGFVVKQEPAAGARVGRQAAVGVTLSGTAAGVTPVPPR